MPTDDSSIQQKLQKRKQIMGKKNIKMQFQQLKSHQIVQKNIQSALTHKGTHAEPEQIQLVKILQKKLKKATDTNTKLKASVQRKKIQIKKTEEATWQIRRLSLSS